MTPAYAESASQMTGLLVAWQQGSACALDALVPLVEAELRQIARRCLRRQGPEHVLQTTALVNEAFVRKKKYGRTES